MSDDIVASRLKQLDHEAEIEEKRLSFVKRFIRRYVSGRSFLVFFIAKHYGMAEGVILATPLKASFFAFIAKVPFVAVAWEYAVALFEGAVAIWNAH